MLPLQHFDWDPYGMTYLLGEPICLVNYLINEQFYEEMFGKKKYYFFK